MMEGVLCGSEDLNMDGVYTVMGMYKQAIVLTRGKGVEYEAMAHSKLGNVRQGAVQQIAQL